MRSIVGDLLLLRLADAAGGPMNKRLYQGIREAILDGSIAADSRLPELPLASHDGLKLVSALADRYAALGATTRAAIETSGRAGDADTSDLFTGISRELDKALWFLEAHLG